MRKTTWIDLPKIGHHVRVRNEDVGDDGSSWSSWSEGRYEGVVASEWTGEPIHFFTHGSINGTPQGCFGFPADGCEITNTLTPTEIVRRRDEAVAKNEATLKRLSR